MEEVLKAYEGKVSYIFKQYPLPMHQWARPAAVASLCAYKQDNNAFWKMHDYMFLNQQQITPANMEEKFKEAAKQAGLNMLTFDSCMKNQETAPKVEQDMKEGNDVGVRSTPTFFVNGYRIVGAQDVQAFKDTIEKALRE